jgi:predicted NUDIX family phosphoesterase
MSKVLCCRKAELPPAWLAGGLVARNRRAMFDVLDQMLPHWIERAEAEASDDFVQIIPYAVLDRPDGKIGLYWRAGTEGRLHGLASIGIGGHIDPNDSLFDDDESNGVGWRRTITATIGRELGEEFPGAMCYMHGFLGVLHDPSTPVGRVHLGIAMVLGVDGNGSPGPELRDFVWVEPSHIPAHNFEPWSKMLLPELRK